MSGGPPPQAPPPPAAVAALQPPPAPPAIGPAAGKPTGGKKPTSINGTSASIAGGPTALSPFTGSILGTGSGASTLGGG